MLRRIFRLIENRPVICTIIFTVIFSLISTVTYEKYRDWKDPAAPIVSLSDIRISPEFNSLFLKDDDLIPTSIELMEYLRGDIRARFVGLKKILPYKKYYNYLKDNKKSINIYDSEKDYFTKSLTKILEILKNKNVTEKDKDTFFDNVWRNYNRIWRSFDVLISTGSIGLEYFEQLESVDKRKTNSHTFIFQKILINPNSPKEKYILRKKRGVVEYLSSQKNDEWDDLRHSNELKFYKALEDFDQKTLISVFEKILEQYEKKLKGDSLKKIEHELDQISRWEVDLLITNKGKYPLGVLPYAFLVVETKKPTKDHQSYRIPLEYRINYNTLRTFLLSGKNSARITFLSKERIGENLRNIKLYNDFKNGNSQCKIEIYTSSKSDPIFSENISFEPSTIQ